MGGGVWGKGVVEGVEWREGNVTKSFLSYSLENVQTGDGLTLAQVTRG